MFSKADGEETDSQRLADSKFCLRILPVFYSDNYVSVLPGESKTVMLDYTPSAANANVLVSLERWNGEEQFISIE